MGQNSATVGASTYQRIKRDIIFGALKPGSKLKLDALKQRYPASLSTLREALNRLASDGFVDAPQQRGFLVTPVSREDLAEIASHMESLYLDPDEVVIRQGDIGDELYILVSGAVRVEIDGVDKGAMPEGAVFGDLAALDPEPRAATIITTEPSHALVLSNEHLMGLFESNVEIAAGVISTLVRRLRNAPITR